MDKIEKLDGKSMDIVEKNIQQLKELFPSAFSEGKIKFNQLEELLGNYVVTDEDHYNFSWHGKRKAGRLAQTPSTGTLRPCEKESVDWDTTENLFIEGDNLEVLKLLQKSYHRQVKMIYIDPPYNTGNDFVYKDDFNDGVKNYLELTGQLDNEGKKMGTNSSAAGRFHTNWLNMMYPRLKLARNLMREDGVIFISIDDNEQINLKKLCDEVFGEENFVSNTIRVSNSAKNNVNQISITHEYTLIYCKNKSCLSKDWAVPKNQVREFKSYANRLFREGLSSEEIEKELKVLTKYPRFYEFDHFYYCDSKGVYQTDNPGGVTNGNKVSEIFHPVTKTTCRKPDGGWRYKEDRIREIESQNRWHFGENENTIPRLKRYLDDCLTSKPTGVHFFDSQSDAKMLKKMGLPFDFPKPKDYIAYLLKMNNFNEGIVLDFFAGSGTTAHAVMELNVEDGGNRKCISVQLPEVTDEKSDAFNAGYTNIADMTKARFCHAGKKVKDENPDYAGDLGFKVFKLDTSNIRRWKADFDTLKTDLISAVDYLVDGRSDEDVLYELCLKLGLDLTMKIEEKNIVGKKVSILGRGYLVVCLDNDITMELANGLGALKEELVPEDGMRVVFKDDGFKDDVVKTNALQTLKRYGIDDVKSL
ncbi:MAG: site-specific DNA-methyltransferase [Emcibacteraceae bacterium]|nr:site-specific DNA-methyltransferase [Emcibacteraceae bacterium]